MPDAVHAPDAEWDAGDMGCGERVLELRSRLGRLKRKLDESSLVAGAAIAGGVKLVEFLSDASPCVSY